jgi:hypothetical protein
MAAMQLEQNDKCSDNIATRFLVRASRYTGGGMLTGRGGSRLQVRGTYLAYSRQCPPEGTTPPSPC